MAEQLERLEKRIQDWEERERERTERVAQWREEVDFQIRGQSGRGRLPSGIGK